MKYNLLFLKLDFLGKTQNFRIAKQDTFRTSIGALFSLIIVTVISCFFIYLFLNVILMKNLKVVTTHFIDENPPKISLSNASYIIALSLQNPDYSVYIDESIYSINLTLLTIIRLGDGSVQNITEPLELIQCSKYKFTLIPEYFNLMDINNLYCINTTRDIFLQGSFGQENWTYLNFEFNKCVNSTKNNNSCLSEELINQKLEGGYIGLFVTDFAVYPNDYKEPFHLYGKNIFTGFSGQDYLDFWIYLKQIEVQTDTGLLLRQIKTKKSFQFESTSETLDHRGGKNFLSVKLRLAKNKEIFERSYTKLHEVVADFGGIIKFCWIVGEIFVYFFRELLYKDYILSFFFEKKEQKDTAPLDKKNSSKLSFNLHKSDTNLKKHKYLNYMNNASTLSHPTRTFINHIVSPIHTINKQRTKFFYNRQYLGNNFSLIAFNKEINNPSNKEVSQECSFNSANDSQPNNKVRNNVPEEQLVKQNNYLVQQKFTEQSDFMLSCDSKIKIFRYKRKITLLKLMGPCLFSKKIRERVYDIHEQFKRILFWFDVIHYLKQNNDLVFIKQFLFEPKQLQRFKNKYAFELSTLNDMNIFNNKIQSSLLFK